MGIAYILHQKILPTERDTLPTALTFVLNKLLETLDNNVILVRGNFENTISDRLQKARNIVGK